MWRNLEKSTKEMSSNLLLNNRAIIDTVKGKNDKVGGKLGKKIFYNWYGRAHRPWENIVNKSVN
jgi:hypothetical protein